MLVKVATLVGPALDWVVAKCISPLYWTVSVYQDNKDRWRIALHGEQGYFAPSTDWAQGGPLIDLAGIAVSFGPQWTAVHNQRLGHCYYGPTPLIAICRCYVASQLGNEIEIPNELFKGN